MNANLAVKQDWEKLSNDFTQQLNGHGTATFFQKNAASTSDLAQLSFPSRKHEEWKYTSFDRVLKNGLTPVVNQMEWNSEWEKLALIEDLEAATIWLLNGEFQKADQLPDGLSLKHRKSASEMSEFKPHFEDIFEQINQRFSLDQIELVVERNVTLTTPIQLINIVTNQESWSQHRLHIEVKSGATATLIERHIDVNEGQSLSNCRCYISQEAQSNFHHIILQDGSESASQLNRAKAEVARDAVYSRYTISLSGKIVRNDCEIALNQENGLGNLYGLYLLEGKEHVDNHTLVDHKVAHCESNELYKGVLMDRSIGVFNGKVYVQEDAQKTNAYQQNRNLLLSDEATINTKPQLEIWADDVKCSHGCTVGQLDKEKLFYLQSRGIAADDARALMVYAFASEVIEKIPLNPLKNYLFQAIAKKLAFDLNS